MTKRALANAILDEVGEHDARLLLLGPSPSRTPGFDETPASYVRYLVKNRTKKQLEDTLDGIIADKQAGKW